MAIDSEASIPEVLEVPTPFQDDLAGLAEEDVMRDADDTTSVMSIQPKGVLLDDHHYYEEKEDERYVAPRRLPKGTSSYQAAWILDEDYDEEEYEDEGDEDIAMDIEEYAPRPEDGDEGIMGDSKSTYAPTEFDSKSVRFLDPSPEEEADQ